jgi:hypothetical protein
MNLSQLEAQWEQLKVSIKTRRQVHIDSSSDSSSDSSNNSSSQTKHGDPDILTDNQAFKYRLPLDYIKDSLDKWNRDKK